MITGGYSACDVTGLAEIAYDTRGGWSSRSASVSTVSGPGSRSIGDWARSDRRPGSSVPTIWLDSGDPIELIIYDRLEHEWSARVQRQVDDRIVDDRIDARRTHGGSRDRAAMGADLRTKRLPQPGAQPGLPIAFVRLPGRHDHVIANKIMLVIGRRWAARLAAEPLRAKVVAGWEPASILMGRRITTLSGRLNMNVLKQALLRCGSCRRDGGNAVDAGVGADPRGVRRQIPGRQGRRHTERPEAITTSARHNAAPTRRPRAATTAAAPAARSRRLTAAPKRHQDRGGSPRPHRRRCRRDLRSIPSKIDPKYASECVGKGRQHTCRRSVQRQQGDQWQWRHEVDRQRRRILEWLRQGLEGQRPDRDRRDSRQARPNCEDIALASEPLAGALLSSAARLTEP